MSDIWVLAADSGHARLFSTDSPIGELKEQNTLADATARLAERDLGTDRPGQQFESVGPGANAYEQPTSTKEAVADEFARDIAQLVEKGRQQGEFDRLYLIAAPDFLGRLRKALPSNTQALIKDSIDKNVTKQDVTSIRKQLPERL